MNETKLSPAALEARRKYQREYYRKAYKEHPEKFRAARARYWENVARKQLEATEETNKEDLPTNDRTD